VDNESKTPAGADTQRFRRGREEEKGGKGGPEREIKTEHDKVEQEPKWRTGAPGKKKKIIKGCKERRLKGYTSDEKGRRETRTWGRGGARGSWGKRGFFIWEQNSLVSSALPTNERVQAMPGIGHRSDRRWGVTYLAGAIPNPNLPEERISKVSQKAQRSLLT